MRKAGITAGTLTQASDITSDNSNPIVRQRAERLREAVRLAGGISTVSRQSGIPIGTITHYLGGRDMKASAMISLADACGVSLGWLASGEWPMLPERDDSSARHEEVTPLVHSIDRQRFSQAVEYAIRSFHPTVHFPDFSSVASSILAIYEHLGAPKEMQDAETLARLLSLPWVAEHRDYLERLRDSFVRSDRSTIAASAVPSSDVER